MTRRNRCTGLVVALFLVACLGAFGCGRNPRGANAETPQPVAVTPAPPAPVRVAPQPEPQPMPPPEPVEVVEPEPANIVEAPVEPEPLIPESVPMQDYLALAGEAADRGDCATAMQLVRRYRHEQADNVMLRIREAGLANDCGRPQRAIELLIDHDARTRAMEPVTAVLSDAYLLLNEPGKAAMTWELRYIVDPEAWDAAVHAATLWLEAGVHGAAHWWYEQARAAAPNSPEVEMLATVFEDERDSDG